MLDSSGRTSRRWPALIGVALLVGAAAAGVWIVLTDPFAARREVTRAPPAAADNLLGAAWSFETDANTSPSQEWAPAEGAPAGFAFGERGAVSGSQAAAALVSDAGWARVYATRSHRINGGAQAVEVAAVSSDPSLQLLLSFEADGRSPLAVVAAAGEGALSGRVDVPPGYTHVRVGLGALGDAAVDDVSLRLVDAAGSAGDLLPGGQFEAVALPMGLALLRGDERALHLAGVSIRDASGAMLPPLAAFLPAGESGSGALAGPGGLRAPVTSGVASRGKQLVMTVTLGSAPSGAELVHTLVVEGGLTHQPVGVGLAAGFESFTEDFTVEQARSLVFGGTSDRIVVSGEPFALSGEWRNDGRIVLRLARPARAGVPHELTLQTSFLQERVEAAQLRDQALQDEGDGDLGRALATLETILRDHPFDEEVLAEAGAARARLSNEMRERLDTIERDLDDALFLASAQRCREVLADCLDAARTFSGSSAEERFREQARTVATRAAELLEEDRRRRADRIGAVRDSFRAAGGFDAVDAELTRYLDTTLAPDRSLEGSEPAGASAGAPAGEGGR